VNDAESDVDRAISDAARLADPVPPAVLDAAKRVYERRPPTGAASTDDEVDGSDSVVTSRTKKASLTT
jgi:hypothetical protein